MQEETLIQTTGARDCAAAVEVSGMTRSSLLLRGALAAGAVYGVSRCDSVRLARVRRFDGGDAEILNFALTLEYLESDVLQREGPARSGSPGPRRATRSCSANRRPNTSRALMTTIKQLGRKPVAKPTFVFPGQRTRARSSKLASVLENTGVGAYNGAGPVDQSKEVLAAAGSIVQVEARHAAAMNLLLGQDADARPGLRPSAHKRTGPGQGRSADQEVGRHARPRRLAARPVTI